MWTNQKWIYILLLLLNVGRRVGISCSDVLFVTLPRTRAQMYLYPSCFFFFLSFFLSLRHRFHLLLA